MSNVTFGSLNTCMMGKYATYRLVLSQSIIFCFQLEIGYSLQRIRVAGPTPGDLLKNRKSFFKDRFVKMQVAGKYTGESSGLLSEARTCRQCVVTAVKKDGGCWFLSQNNYFGAHFFPPFLAL